MTRHLALVPALSFIAAAAACTDTASHDGPAVTGGVARLEFPFTLNRNVDLLFVIDNSPGMAPHRARLLDDYRRFIAVLETIRGGLPDVHIGVITTDVGTRGAYDTGPGPSIGTGAGSCTSDGDRGELRRVAAIDGNFLSDVVGTDGSRERNYTGSLADAFVQLADVGAAGCTYARPLEAMRRALGDNPANAGFRRDDAYFAVVLLTNDDDCSFGSASFVGDSLDRSRCTANVGALVPADEYVTFLKSTAPEPTRIIVLGGFAPPDQPACADARPAVRLDAFTGGFPDRSHVVSICEPDLSGLLSPLTPGPAYSPGPPCFGVSLLDVDPVAAGLQVECASWYRYEAQGELVDELIPACQGSAPAPCWQIRSDPYLCPVGELVEFRHRPFPSDIGALAIIECVSR